MINRVYKRSKTVYAGRICEAKHDVSENEKLGLKEKGRVLLWQ